MTYNLQLNAAFAHVRHWPSPAPAIPIQPEPWMDGALCTQADPESFYPEGQGGSAREAKRICQGCDVRADCLAYALERHEDWGVWGGTSPRERRQMRRAS